MTRPWLAYRPTTLERLRLALTHAELALEHLPLEGDSAHPDAIAALDKALTLADDTVSAVRHALACAETYRYCTPTPEASYGDPRRD